MTDQLDPIEPTEAVELFYSHREPEVSEKTLYNDKTVLNPFVEWCEETGLQNLNRLTGRDLHRFRIWRRSGEGSYDSLKKVTLRGQLRMLQKFLEFGASIDAVEKGMREKVLIPDVDAEEETRDEHLEPDRANELLAHLEKFEYAGRDHIIIALAWHAGIRLGSLRAFDVDDFDPDAQCLDLRHRPETGTPLKNKQAAERSIAIGEYYCQVVTDYIEYNREDVRDDYSRRPLITSSQGRLSATSIRDAIYCWSRPCMIGACPHDRDPDTCEAMEYGKASRCPSSRSPHGIRRGSITKHLRDGTPREVVSERMNVSPAVLDQHYDERTEREKMELRREFLEEG